MVDVAVRVGKNKGKAKAVMIIIDDNEILQALTSSKVKDFGGDRYFSWQALVSMIAKNKISSSNPIKIDPREIHTLYYEVEHRDFCIFYRKGPNPNKNPIGNALTEDGNRVFSPGRVA